MEETPSAFFRGVDPKLVIDEMLLGSYKLDLNDLPPTKANTNVTSRERLVPGESSTDSSFKISSNNDSKIILTTNHKSYASYLDGGDQIASHQKTKYKCHWCRRVRTNKSVGIPVKIDNEDDKKIFHCHGQYCTFSCAYAHLILLIRIKDPRYQSSECLLKYLFTKMYPEGTLKEAPDWTSLESNGGPLTSSQFDNKDFTIIDCPGIILLPVKTLLTLIK